jgi:glutaredoxin
VPLLFVYLTWLVYEVGLAYFPLKGEFQLTVAWLVGFPLALWGYMRVFPRLAPFLGYGRVDDNEVESVPSSRKTVTMYSSLGCPFCPLVEKRLRELEKAMGFEFRHVDVTLKPELVRAKHIRAVPVVEVDDRRVVGHATTAELARIIAGEVP